MQSIENKINFFQMELIVFAVDQSYYGNVEYRMVGLRMTRISENISIIHFK